MWKKIKGVANTFPNGQAQGHNCDKGLEKNEENEQTEREN